MATDTVKHPWNDERRRLCLEGVYELDKIARVLPQLVPLDDDQNHYAVKALAGRMLRLTSMLMSGMDEYEATAKLEDIVHFGVGAG
jgi:hypothetical protein